MPTQWRTIGTRIGRTAAQCLEHYEKLLDILLFKLCNGVAMEADSFSLIYILYYAYILFGIP